MIKLKFFTENVAIAAFLGYLLGMAYVALLSSGYEENVIKFGTYGLTILSGLLASGLALAGVMANLNFQEEARKRESDNSLAAARAVLPFTLSTLHRLSEQGFETAMKTESLRKGTHADAMAAVRALEVPSGQIERLQKCIEYTGDHSKEWLSLIIAHWQIETSRLESSLLDKRLSISSYQIKSSAADWLLIRALISHLFDFSRTGIEPEDELDRSEFTAPFFGGHFDDSELLDAIERHKKYFDECGGWTTRAFRERMKIPS